MFWLAAEKVSTAGQLSAACTIAIALLTYQANAIDGSLDDGGFTPSAIAVEHSQALKGTTDSICLMLESAATTHGLPVEFFTRLIWQESRFRTDAIGPATRNGRQAEGIAQFMPATAAERNLLNPFDPIQALPKAAEYLRQLRQEFGNLGLAAAAYNAGARRVREWLSEVGSLPSETRKYVKSITGLSVEDWARGEGSGLSGSKSKPPCGDLVAVLKNSDAPPFVAVLEQRILVGSAQPWSVILTAGFSKTQILSRYAQLQRQHASALSGYDAFITPLRLRSRGLVPFYQVRVGVADARAGSALCDRILSERGACMIMRTPRA